MDFRELQYILAIAKYQNITKAAESLYITQPTLSKFLISLERSLNQPLFQKVGHRYYLTYAGECYVEKANEILRLKNDLDMEMADILKNDVGVLNIAMPPMRSLYLPSATFPEYRRMHPNIKIQLFEGYSNQNDLLLRDGKADLAFSSRPSDLNPLLEYEAICEEQLVLCISKDNPICEYAYPNPEGGYPIMNPALLESECFLSLQPGQRTRTYTDRLIQDLKLHFENTMAIGNIAAIISLVNAGYGFSFLFNSHIDHAMNANNIALFQIKNVQITSAFVVSYRRNSYQPKYVRDYIELTKKFFS